MTPDERRARQRIAQLKYRTANRDKMRAESRAYYARNRESELARHRRYKKANVEKLRLARGLPRPERPEPATCEICGRHPPTGRTLCLDHCHTTGKFRGWICSRCNTAIGRLGDSLAGIRLVVAYLERSE